MSTQKPNHQSRLRTTQENTFQQIEISSENKDIKSLKIELQLWNQTYNEIVEIFTDIVPHSKEVPKNSVDKQKSLLVLCREIAKIAKDPKKSKEYQNLLYNFRDCQNKLADLSQKNAAMINDTYSFSWNNDNDTNQAEQSHISDRLNNLNNILSREIEENKMYLPNHSTIEPTLNNVPSEPIPLAKKPSIIISSQSKKKGRSIFPSVSELLSNSFHQKTKNDIFLFAPDNICNQNNLELNESKKEVSSVPLNISSVPSSLPVQNDPPKVNKSKQITSEEIPFGKRADTRSSRNRIRAKKS